MRVRPEGQSVGAEVRVTNVTSPILNMGKLVTQSYRFEAGPTGRKMSKQGSQCVGRCEEFSLVNGKAYRTAEGARNADATLQNYRQAQARTPNFQTARAPRGSPGEDLDSYSPVARVKAPVWGTKAQM